MTKDEKIVRMFRQFESRLSQVVGKRVCITLGDKIERMLPENVLEIICSLMDVSSEAVRGPLRFSKIAEARFLTCWYLHYKYGMNKSEIAAFLNRHHTSIINAIKTTNNRLEAKDERTIAAMNTIDQRLILKIKDHATHA